MITCITGLPGHGKTLYAVTLIKAMAEKEKRDVFYSGIKGVMLPWTEFVAEEWMALPTGSMIVIDEAQFVFPKLAPGAKHPDFYKLLATHRHQGFDIFLITQDVTLIDLFPRKLIDRHLHVVRKFGLQRATVYEFQGAKIEPLAAKTVAGAVVSKWAYPKSSFGLYKSAEVHTVKTRIPAKIILAVLFIVSFLVFAFFMFKHFQA
ncbi:zonular occludens toxin domain-containing protein, partial [Pseudomonas sp.]|uniref:zonular occludens toxin domain-containing protein n=1 Tax=Pseudomonas sp. TaxID=306 RepID=UPI00262FC6F0